MGPDTNELINLYRTMLTIRRFEERVSAEYAKGNALGYVHLYIGEEAVATGVCNNLRIDDRIVSHHRGHGHSIAKGADIKRMMAEVFGKKTGYCKGKGGSMHIADFGIGMLGANGIVGAGLPIAVGAALAAQLEKKDKIAAVFFGDGASQEGEFHESLSLASVWHLPMLFVCENNLYAAGTPARFALPLQDIYKKAEGYNMLGVVVDGNDVVAVNEAAGELVTRAREGGGPALLECKTYRWHEHFESTTFPDMRPKEELESWKKKCPVARTAKQLLEEGILTEQELTDIDSEILKKIDEAVKFAEESPFPDPEDALEDVYSD
ncbi:MAG TPA: thiamine pyrophosphate-dependent dehydrogenase E1 component subunit alpha [Dehalococcoidia bacterium]|nr:thiamine pyrophosphate-dependent dehydrogenase E1 component subunit alpha [Dehalococcoidia bacterium]